MLQRIQTLCLSFVLLAMWLFFLFPIWQKVDLTHPQSYYILYAWYMKEATATTAATTTTLTIPFLSLGGMAVAAGLVSLYEITQFKNRIIQLRLGAFNNLLLTAMMGYSIYLITKIHGHLPQIAGAYQLGFFMPLLAIVGNLIANYFIRKDEKLMRSIDRIR